MSADNGIYILVTKDGYRVIHTQAIDNLYWYWNDDRLYNSEWCRKYQRKTGKNPYAEFGGREKFKMNPIEVKKYFGNCEVYKTEKEAIEKAMDIKEQIINSICPILEHGINFIYGMSKENFPE